MKRELPVVHLYMDYDGTINPLELRVGSTPTEKLERAFEFLYFATGADPDDLYDRGSDYIYQCDDTRDQVERLFYPIDRQDGDLTWSSELIDDLVKLTQDYNIEWNWLTSNYRWMDKIVEAISDDRLPDTVVIPYQRADGADDFNKLDIMGQELSRIDRLDNPDTDHVVIWVDDDYYNPLYNEVVERLGTDHRVKMIKVSPCPATGLSREDIDEIRMFIEAGDYRDYWL